MPLFQPLLAPQLRNADTVSVRRFLEKYEDYEEVFTERKQENSIGAEIQPTALKRCVEKRLLKRLAVFELETTVEDLTDEALRNYLEELVTTTKKELDLDLLFGRIRFKTHIKEYREMVGDMFQQVDAILEENNIEGEFPDKVINQYIVDVVEPKELRQRVKYHMSTTTGKAKMKKRSELYKYLLEMYGKWYELHPTGRVAAGGDGNQSQGSAATQKKNAAVGSGGESKKSSPTKGQATGKGQTPKTPTKAPRDGSGCWVCKGNHFLSQCPTATPEQKERARAKPKPRRLEGDTNGGTSNATQSVRRVARPTPGQQQRPSSVTPALVNEGYKTEVGLDWMASRTTITEGTLAEMRQVVAIAEKTVPEVQFEMGDARRVATTKVIIIDLQLLTRHCPVTIRRVSAYVLPGEATTMLLGEPELARLGYKDPSTWLEELAENATIDVQAVAPLGEEDAAKAAPQRIKRLRVLRAGESPQSQPSDDELDTACSSEEDVPEQGVRLDKEPMGPNERDALELALVAMLRRAEENGAAPATVARLKEVVMKYEDIFRLELGHDPPARVEPMVIELLDESGVATQPRARRFAPLQMEFLHQHVEMLLRMGVVRRGTGAHASPVVLVRKKDGTWRMCVDLRRINANTKPMRWPLPKIHELLPHLAGAAFFASFDLLRGYWQFPVAPGSTAALGFVTHEGLFEFQRVVMGALNSAGHFQKIMSKVLQGLVLTVVLLYIDDILVYACTEADLVEAVERVFARLRQYGIKLKPSKCELFCTQLVWCGHLVSAAGIGVSPEYTAAVHRMKCPTTAAELQQFLGSCGWVRTKIPAYAHLVAPLQELLTAALANSKKRNARAAAKIKLAEVGWTCIHDDAYEAVKRALADAVTLAHLRDDTVVCLFPDASELFWGAMLTQVPQEAADPNVPVSEWLHEPLGFLSGAFKGASLNWAIPDKEGYAIKESCARFTHFLIREGGFRVFTDHRNLRYIFNPRGVVSQVSKPTADRLERWAVFLRAFTYEIEHIPGETNIWADMLSRWAAGTAAHLAQRERVGHPVVRTHAASTGRSGGAGAATAEVKSAQHTQRAAAVGLRARGDRILTEERHTAQRRNDGTAREQDAEERWPTMEEIIRAQEHAADATLSEEGGTRDEEDGVWRCRGKVLVPAGAHRLRERIMVVAHAGAAGHRGIVTTMALLRGRFAWKTMESDVQALIRGCLLCVKTRGNKVVPRPLGEALQGATPGDALHMDFTSLVEESDKKGVGVKGVLVLKDGFTTHVTLWPASEYDAATAEEAAVAWATIYGVPRILVTDGGTHFDNTIIKALQKRFRAEHHITTAYAPWANGVVERVNRELIRLFRTLLAESNLPKEEWPALVPLVQATLNQTPSTARGGLTPNQLMLGRETPRPLDTVAYGRLPTEATIAMAGKDVVAAARQYFDNTAAALQESWLKAAAARERRHQQNATQRERQVEGRGADRQFAIGEYVLVHVPVPRHKLRVQWLGPYRVADTVNDWVYVVEDVVTKRRKTVHVDRLKWYADDQLRLTEDLRNQVAYDSQFYVDKLVDWRATDEDKLELRVRWLGLEPNEDSWEPVERLREDVPEICARYVQTIADECEYAPALLREWGVPQVAAGGRRRRRRAPRRD